MECEERQARQSLGPIVGLKKSILPKLDVMIKEQKKIKDAQKTAIAVTTKKMCDIGASLSKLAEKQAVKERELAGLLAKIVLTSKEQEKVDTQRDKCKKSLAKINNEMSGLEEKLNGTFEEWKNIADQAKLCIERHEEERRRSLDELLEEYKSCGNNAGNANLSRMTSTNSLLNPRSAYSTSIDQLNKATGVEGSQGRMATSPPSYQTSTTDTVKALYPYTAQSKEELSFNQGDTIEVLDKQEDPWWRGKHRGGQVGLFPSNFVRKV